MAKNEILQLLKQEVQEKLQNGNTLNKKSRQLYESIAIAPERDFIIGDCPSYFYAYMECNSTAVGESSFGGTTQQRTVALDYVTDEYLFAEGHPGTALKGFELFHLKEGETGELYKKEDMERVAKQYGHSLHAQKFRDLNITMYSHRLNRYSATVTKGPFSYPIRPIHFCADGAKAPVLVGYTYTYEGDEYFIFDTNDELSKKPPIFSPWMLLSFIFPPLLIVSLGVIFYRCVYR